MRGDEGGTASCSSVDIPTRKVVLGRTSIDTSRAQESMVIVVAPTTGGNEEDLRDMAQSEQELCSKLINLQDHHWRIRKADVEILLRPDGTDWLLGSGAYAKVYRGILNKSIPVAIKTIGDSRESSKSAFIEEAVAHMNLRHANVVQFYGCVIQEDDLLLIMEYMPRGTLYDAIAADREGKLKWFGRGRILALDIVRGLLHIHNKGIIHQDIKSNNILLNKDWSAKVADLGLFSMPVKDPERNIRRESEPDSESVGNLQWVAPEVLIEGPSAVSYPADVYSLGIVLGEIITGRPPEGRSVDLTSEDCPPKVAAIVMQCLEHSPKDRPTVQEVFNVLSEHQPPKTRPLGARKL